MKHIKPLEDINTGVRMFAQLMAIRWAGENPDWVSGDIEEDYWHHYGDYDLNLWCKNGLLRVSAYPTYKDERGDTATDCSSWVTIVNRGSGE